MAHPLATVTFADRSINNVTLTMSASNLVIKEFTSIRLFNFDPNPDFDPFLLTFRYDPFTVSNTLSAISDKHGD